MTKSGKIEKTQHPFSSSPMTWAGGDSAITAPHIRTAQYRPPRSPRNRNSTSTNVCPMCTPHPHNAC